MKPCDPTTHFMWTCCVPSGKRLQHPAFTSAALSENQTHPSWVPCRRCRDLFRQTDRRTDGGEVQTVDHGATFWSVGGGRMSLMYMWPHMGHMDEHMATARWRQSCIVNRCFNTFFSSSATLPALPPSEHERRMRTSNIRPLWPLILNGIKGRKEQVKIMWRK